MLSLNFKVPKYVQVSILMSLGGVTFGLDTGTIGPLTTMPQFSDTFGELSSTLHGLVVSTILIAAATSSFFAGHLANSIGRVKAVAIGATFFGIGAAIEAGSVRLGMLFAGRAIKGLGEGLFMSTSVVYITEISPPHYRGTLGSIPQFLTTFALCAGYFICYGSVNIASSFSWRLPFVVQAVISFIFASTTILLLPESPRWLSSRGNKAEALAAWDKLEIGTADRGKHEENDVEEIPQAVKIRDILDTFHRDVWKQTSLGVFLNAMQQLSGIDGVLYYAPLLFAAAGLNSTTASFLASGISAILIFLVTIPAFLLADKWGRKSSTTVGGIIQLTCMFVIGSLYAAGAVHKGYGPARWVVIVLIYIFAMTYAATWAVTFRVYSSEIQPPKTRAGASSLGLSANLMTNWIVAFTTPIFLAKSDFGVYFLFGGAALITVIVCAIWMPETKGKSLEEIQGSFQSSKRLVVPEMGGLPDA